MAEFLRLNMNSHATDRLGQFNATRRLVMFADIIGPRLAARIRQRAPRSKTPSAGRLADSTRYTRRTAISMVRMEFTSNVRYAPYVIKATKAHDIVPRAALMLHWQTPGGVNVFARKVRHPGTKANDYPKAALKDMMPEIIATFHRGFERF